MLAEVDGLRELSAKGANDAAARKRIPRETTRKYAQKPLTNEIRVTSKTSRRAAAMPMRVQPIGKILSRPSAGRAMT